MDKMYTEKIEQLLGDYFEYRKAKETDYKTTVQKTDIPQRKNGNGWFPKPLPSNGAKTGGKSGGNNSMPAPLYTEPMPVTNNPSVIPPNGPMPADIPIDYPLDLPAGAPYNVPASPGMPVTPVTPTPPADMTPAKTEGDYASALSDNVSKKLVPYAEYEVDKMDYEDSPIYDDLDKETVAQMSLSAYNNAVQNVPELGDLETEGERAYYTKTQIVKSLIRELILKEIYLKKRARLLKKILY